MGNVYFARCAGLIKIGYAQDVGQRLCQLQTGNPEAIEIIAVLENVRPALERELHAYFAASRARGEWFHPSVELLAVIAHVQGGARITNSIDADYYADLVPNTRMHANPHIDTRITAKRLLELGYGWQKIKEMLLARGPEYAAAVAAFGRKVRQS